MEWANSQFNWIKIVVLVWILNPNSHLFTVSPHYANLHHFLKNLNDYINSVYIHLFNYQCDHEEGIIIFVLLVTYPSKADQSLKLPTPSISFKFHSFLRTCSNMQSKLQLVVTVLGYIFQIQQMNNHLYFSFT